MRFMLRPSSGSRRIPKQHMMPGKSAFLLDVSVFSYFFPPCMSDKTTKHNINSCVFLSLPGQETASKPLNKVEMRRQYLMEKYVWKWKQFMRSRSEGLFPRLLKLGHNNWLRQVMLL